jgi:signal recognition particle subunit SEC65
LINKEINFENSGFYCTLSQDLMKNLSSYKILRRKSLSYRLILNHQEKRMVCPLLKNSTGENNVLWPSEKLPFRKYPVYVYTYAIALYLSSSISMRKTARKVCQKFGLENFSHSTLSRVLKKLSINIETILSVKHSNQFPPGTAPPIAKRAWWSSDQFLRYQKIHNIVHPVLIKENEVDFSRNMNYQYYIKYGHFLI